MTIFAIVALALVIAGLAVVLWLAPREVEARRDPIDEMMRRNGF